MGVDHVATVVVDPGHVVRWPDLPRAGFDVSETVLTSPLDSLYFPTTSNYYVSLRDQAIKILYRLIGRGSYLSIVARKRPAGENFPA